VLKYKQQDITTIESGMIAHGCNVKKRFASGVALAIRNKWQMVYDRYMIHCHRSHYGTADIIQLNNNLFVANCYTQLSYGHDGEKYASVEAIHSSLKQVCTYITIFNIIPDLFIPTIGCGLGGLSYDSDVLPILELLTKEFLNINITVCTI
jgi:O-acetyl-ADP-ribose deacetylase (regulator of RNase III)